MIFPCDKQLGHGCGDIIQAPVPQFVGVQNRLDLGVFESRAQVGVTHGAIRQFSAAIQVRSERCAQRNAVVGSRGLHEKVVDQPGRRDFSVGFRIQRHAAGHAEIARAGFLHRHAHHAHHGEFAGFLHGEGDIFVALVDFTFGNSRRTQQPDYFGKRIITTRVQSSGVHTIRIGLRIDERA